MAGGDDHRVKTQQLLHSKPRRGPIGVDCRFGQDGHRQGEGVLEFSGCSTELLKAAGVVNRDSSIKMTGSWWLAGWKVKGR